MRDQDSVAVLTIGATRCYGDEWFRELTVQGVTFLAPLDQQDKARHILQSQQDGAQGGDAALYAAAGKGFHVSETCGPEGKYWHVSKFQSLADLQAYEHAWREVMLAARDRPASRPAIAPQATPAAVDANWFADVRRCLEDVSTEMRARGRGDDRFQRLIQRMPAALAAPPAEVKP